MLYAEAPRSRRKCLSASDDCLQIQIQIQIQIRLFAITRPFEQFTITCIIRSIYIHWFSLYDWLCIHLYRLKPWPEERGVVSPSSHLVTGDIYISSCFQIRINNAEKISRNLGYVNIWNTRTIRAIKTLIRAMQFSIVIA